MKAIRVHKNGDTTTLTIEDLPPPKPSTGQVLVKIRASAVQPSDVLNSKGVFVNTTFPRTLGRDFAGTVVEGPSDLVGRDVFGTSGSTFSFIEDGAQAEYALLSIDAIAVKPQQLSFEQAALLGTPFTTANLTLKRANAVPGETVLVLGATGAVGSWIMQLAQAYGCKTIGVGRHGTDIDSTVDPSLSTAKHLTDGKGPNIAIDTVGDLNLTRAAIEVLAPLGRLCTITAPRSGDKELAVDVTSLYRRQISLIGCNSLAYSQADMTRMLTQDLVPLVKSGKLRAPELGNTARLPLDEALGAYSGNVKKAVIVFDE
jgi:NADPH2:quinone reductase